MGIFKKKRYDEEYIADPNYDDIPEDDSLVLPFDDEQIITPWEERNITARHALTPEEVMAEKPKTSENTADDGESLFEKIAKNNPTGEFSFGLETDDTVSTTLDEKDIEMHVVTNADEEFSEEIEPKVPVDEPDSPNSLKPATQIDKIPLYGEVNSDTIDTILNGDATKGEVESLLDKCKTFIYDESTVKDEEFLKDPEPLYTLESVESIISSVKSDVVDISDDEYTPNVSIGKTVEEEIEDTVTESAEDYFKSFNIQKSKETGEDNSKKMHQYTGADDGFKDKIVEAKKIPVNIKMLDRVEDEPIMQAIKDNLDLGATQVIPEIDQRTEVSLDSDDIQMSLADSDIVSPAEDDSSISPEHALFTKKSSIKKELLDDFFDSPDDVEAIKPTYSNIVSDSRFAPILKGSAFKQSVETAKRVADIEENEFATKDFSLSEATAEFNKVEQDSVIEVADQEENEPTARFNAPENLNAISEKLKNNFRTLKVKLLPTALLTLILTVIALFVSQSPTTHLISVGLLLAVCAINYDVIFHITSLFSTNHGIDTPIAFSSILVLIQTVVCGFVFDTEFINLTPVVSLAVTFSIIGKMLMLTRVIKNISLINNTDEKNVLKFVENKSLINMISADFIEGDALIATVKPTVNVNGFTALSFKSGMFEKALSTISLFSIVAAVVCGAAGYVFDLDTSSIISAFCVGICACYPPAALFIINLPLNSASKQLLKQKCAFAGYAGADEMEKCNAITVNATDLFPKGTIKLSKMYVLSENKVDETFDFAYAVAKAANSPLSNMLEEVTENSNTEIVAEDINYEDKMGISGWIKDKRVLIGNRLLMEGHAINIPGTNIDKKILKMGYFPVYIAFDSKPCLLLICSYSTDQEVSYNLRSVCNLGVSVFISSNDPNITEEMVTDYFGLFDGSVKTLSLNQTKALEKEMEFTEDSVSPAVFGKNINGFLKVFSLSSKVKSTAFTMLVTHIALIVLGILAIVYFIATGRFFELDSIKVFLFSIASILITYLSFLIR